MSAFAVNKRGSSSVRYKQPRKAPIVYSTKKRLTGSQLDAKTIKKRMVKDEVGTLLNPNAIKTKFHKSTNHIQKNNHLIKILATARTNKQWQQAEEKRKEKEKGYFQMPRFIATPSKQLVPDVLSRDQQRKEYNIVRDYEIEENNKVLAAAQRATSEDLAFVTKERNQVVADYTSPKKATLKTKEVLLGNHLTVTIAGSRKAQGTAYQAPSHKGPRAAEFPMRGREKVATSPRRPRTAPSKRQKKKIQTLPEHLNVPCWWSNQASAWELLHVGEEGC